MRKLDLDTLWIMVFGLFSSIIGINGTIYCTQNATEVTSMNWFGSIVLAVGGTFLVIVGIWLVLPDRSNND